MHGGTGVAQRAAAALCAARSSTEGAQACAGCTRIVHGQRTLLHNLGRVHNVEYQERGSRVADMACDATLMIPCTCIPLTVMNPSLSYSHQLCRICVASILFLAL